MKQAIFAVALLATAFAQSVQAEGLPIEPGLWKSTSTVTTPFGGPQTNSSESCVEQTSYDPAEMMEGAEDCEMIRSEIEGDTLRFEMSCNMEGNRANMTGRFQSKGSSGNGDMKMQISAGGMDMEMDMEWTAERIGDC